jgi:hypothetical protein
LKRGDNKAHVPATLQGSLPATPDCKNARSRRTCTKNRDFYTRHRRHVQKIESSIHVTIGQFPSVLAQAGHPSLRRD